MRLQSLLFLLVILLLTPIGLYAQFNKKEKKKFFKKYEHLLDKNSEIKFFNYYQVLEKNGTEYVFKTFNPDKKVMTIYETYQEGDLETLNGEYKEWYDNGNLWKKGRYKNNEKSGRWNFYNHSDGNLNQYGAYENGMEQGDWYTVDSLGRTTSKCHYVNGQLDGEYLNYDTSGNVFQKSIYKLGEEIENIMLDSTYRQHELTEIDILPILKECSDLEGEEREQCRETKYLYYVYGNIVYPEKARINGVEGKAIIRFVISKKGRVTEIEALRGVSDEIEKNVLELLKILLNGVQGLIKENQ